MELMHKCIMSSVFDLLDSGFMCHLSIKQFILIIILFCFDVFCIFQTIQSLLMFSLKILFQLIIITVFCFLFCFTALCDNIVILAIVMLGKITFCFCNQPGDFLLISIFYWFCFFQFLFILSNKFCLFFFW